MHFTLDQAKVQSEEAKRMGTRYTIEFGGALAEQLDSVMPHIEDPSEKIETAFHIIDAHRPEGGWTLPPFLQEWYST